MIQALELIEETGSRAAFYLPRNLRAFMRRQMQAQKGAFMSWDEQGGKRIMRFGEVPMRRTDALNVAEAEVLA